MTIPCHCQRRHPPVRSEKTRRQERTSHLTTRGRDWLGEKIHRPSPAPRPPPPLGFMTCEPTTLTEDSMDSCHWTVHMPFRFTIRWSQGACPSFIIHTSPFLCHLCTNLYGLYSHNSRTFKIGNRENDWNLCLHSKTKQDHTVLFCFFYHQKHVMCVYLCTYMFFLFLYYNINICGVVRCFLNTLDLSLYCCTKVRNLQNYLHHN